MWNIIETVQDLPFHRVHLVDIEEILALLLALE